MATKASIPCVDAQCISYDICGCKKEQIPFLLWLIRGGWIPESVIYYLFFSFFRVVRDQNVAALQVQETDLPWPTFRLRISYVPCSQFILSSTLDHLSRRPREKAPAFLAKKRNAKPAESDRVEWRLLPSPHAFCVFQSACFLAELKELGKREELI